MKTFFTSLRMLALSSALFGIFYPLAVWMAGRAFFAEAAEGSLIKRDGRTLGSRLLAQKTSDERLFWPRPSACDYATVPSGASNLPWSSAALLGQLARADAEAGLESRSASGLDPDQGENAIFAQLPRVAAARGWDAAQRACVRDWMVENMRGGLIGPRYMNVLELNLALDKLEGGK